MIFQVSNSFKCIFNDCVLSAWDTAISKYQSASPKNVQWKEQAHTLNKIWLLC